MLNGICQSQGRLHCRLHGVVSSLFTFFLPQAMAGVYLKEIIPYNGAIEE
jgi:hypothetical protein